MTVKEILQDIFDNGRVTSESSQEELEEEFTFSASEKGFSDSEIFAAIKSGWFPKL